MEPSSGVSGFHFMNKGLGRPKLHVSRGKVNLRDKKNQSEMYACGHVPEVSHKKVGILDNTFNGFGIISSKWRGPDLVDLVSSGDSTWTAFQAASKDMDSFGRPIHAPSKAPSPLPLIPCLASQHVILMPARHSAGCWSPACRLAGTPRWGCSPTSARSPCWPRSSGSG